MQRKSRILCDLQKKSYLNTYVNCLVKNLYFCIKKYTFIFMYILCSVGQKDQMFNQPLLYL